MSSLIPSPQGPKAASTSARSVVLDLFCLTALLATAFVPLVVMRGSSRLHESSFLACVFAVGAVVCLAWFSLRRYLIAPSAVAESAAERLPWGRRFAIVTLLLLLTLVCFSLPLRKHFWGGVDEVGSFYPGCAAVWSEEWDNQGRPLLGLAGAVGAALTPGSIIGLLWLGSALCFGNGVLLWAVLRRLFRGAEWLGVAAAVLLICHRGDSLRFMVLGAANTYCMAVFLLLLAFWLFLVSYDSRRRWMLVLACCALGASLLTYEAGYPLALLGPLCLWLSRPNDRDIGVWSFAWLGAMTVTAVRFAHYLITRGHSSYQLQSFSGPLHRPDILAANFLVLLKPILLYVQPWDLPGRFLLSAVAAAAAAGLACLLCRVGREPSRRRVLIGVGVAALGVLLGLAPFLPIGNTYRTQFFVAPAEAAEIALVLSLCGVLGRRIGQALPTAVVALLAGHSAFEAQVSQDYARGAVCFEKTVHIFQQLHTLSPTLPDDVLVLLVGDEGAQSPLGVYYHVPTLSRTVLGPWALQVGCVKSAESGVEFAADSVVARMDGVGLNARYSYDHLIVFRMDGDGGLSLLRRLPTSLASSPEAARRYNPIALFSPGPPSELPYLRYSSWMRQPVDVISPADGVVLGEGWGPLRFGDGRLSRVVEQGAEIVVNPMGAASREIQFQLPPPSQAGASYRLTLLDDDGRTAAVAPVEESGIARAMMTVDPTRVAAFRLRLEIADRPCGSFTVFAPGGPWSSNPNPPHALSALEMASW